MPVGDDGPCSNLEGKGGVVGTSGVGEVGGVDLRAVAYPGNGGDSGGGGGGYAGGSEYRMCRRASCENVLDI